MLGTLNRLLWTLVRGVLRAVPTLVGVVVVSFLLMQAAPGDAADVMAGESGTSTVETMAILRARFGLDQPVLTQFVGFVANLAHFSLGRSPRWDVPVADLILARLPDTLLLMGSALGFAVVLGIGLGAVMASFVNRWPDRILSVVTLLFYSVPGFWTGLMAILIFSVGLGLLPSGGSQTIAAGLTGWDRVWDVAAHLVLPAAALSTFFVAVYARLTRAAMLEVQGQDYVRTATAKGLHPIVVATRHVLRNALVPVTTVAGLHVGSLLGGAMVIETVFSWPGLGRLAFEAVMKRDFSVLLGILVVSSVVVVVVDVLVDLLHAALDPRIEGHGHG
ncbi:ABC transporter permease [Siculibacillus lacustris]|uniref:ABC transporter permease n=1 Tax=Siculibacillus lacustris TaxID=1549641 RepID=A0A4Q9VTP1_9HYPH|nr:ABC transporter permease [Siculibacillus lacustris]TBW38979.1 ABC transporter permease [Siculibacillus lacustris]